jgi:hypothetical protein
LLASPNDSFNPTKNGKPMKTKLTLLLTALAAPFAFAGPDMHTLNQRKEIADRAAVEARRVEVTTYVSENNAKANPRPVASNAEGTTNIAVYKSKKTTTGR